MRIKLSFAITIGCFFIQTFGTTAQTLNSDTLLNSHVSVFQPNGEFTDFKISDAKGDFVIIDFWASWCAPCLEALNSLKEIQKNTSQNLSIISVSGDKRDKFLQFNKVYRSTLINALDDKNELFNRLNIKIIPTTIFYNRKKNTVAVFEGEKLTQGVVDSLMQGLTVAKAKQDVSFMSEPEQVIKSFNVPAYTKNLFRESPHYENSPNFYYNYKNTSYKSRRLTFVNFSVPGLYRYAYNTTYTRYYERSGLNLEKEKLNYKCYDIIVPHDNFDHDLIRKKIILNLKYRYPNIKTAFKKVLVDSCYYLKAIKGFKYKKSVRSKIEIRGPHFAASNILIKDLVNYLEEQTKVVVENRTMLIKRYDFKIDFNYADSSTIIKELANNGLYLETHKNVLVEKLFIE